MTIIPHPIALIHWDYMPTVHKPDLTVKLITELNQERLPPFVSKFRWVGLYVIPDTGTIKYIAEQEFSFSPDTDLPEGEFTNVVHLMVNESRQQLEQIFNDKAAKQFLGVALVTEPYSLSDAERMWREP